MPIMQNRPEGLVGRTFPEAQGIYAVNLVGREADRVVLEVSPELHHGQPRMKYTPSGPGMVVQQLSREVEVFAKLRTEVAMSPGEILVVTCLPGSQNRLGGLFHHADATTGGEQKYLLVRLSQAPPQPVLSAASDSTWPWQ